MSLSVNNKGHLVVTIDTLPASSEYIEEFKTALIEMNTHCAEETAMEKARYFSCHILQSLIKSVPVNAGSPSSVEVNTK